MQRFQLAVYPDDPGEWKNVDRWPDSKAKNRVYSLFEKFNALDPLTIGVQIAEGDGPPFLRFARDAQELFDGWRGELEQKIRTQEEHPIVEAHLAKYRSLMPSLALLFHLLEVVDGRSTGPVSKEAAATAAAWCDLLEAHARRIYQGVTQHALFAARTLAERIKAGKLPSPFTPHNVYHNGWAGLATPEEVERAADIIEGLSWVRAERINTGKPGRPRFHYHINPHLLSTERAI